MATNWPFLTWGYTTTLDPFTPARATTSGSMLIFGMSYQGTPTISGVTDTAGNTYALIGSERVSGGVNKVRLYYAYNITGHAANIATVNVSAGSFSFVITSIFEFAMLNSSDPLQGQNGANGSGTSISSGSVTVTSPAVIVGFATGDSGTLIGANGFFPTQLPGTSGNFFAMPWKYVTSGQACTLTQASNNWAIEAASFTVDMSGGSGGGGGMRMAGHGGLAA